MKPPFTDDQRDR